MKKINSFTESKFKFPYSLPALSYNYSDMEPYIDSQTMEIHHSKHHQAYVDNLNKALENHAANDVNLTELMLRMHELPAVIRNNGGGHFNHSFFWAQLNANGQKKPDADLQTLIEKTFGSLDHMTDLFNQAAMTRFGSGWAWLCIDENNELLICSTPNQDNPLMSVTETRAYPILGIDVWEHAYYLKYQNRRAEYVSAFWKVIDWKVISERFRQFAH